jgi:hypothetical protein
VLLCSRLGTILLTYADFQIKQVAESLLSNFLTSPVSTPLLDHTDFTSKISPIVTRLSFRPSAVRHCVSPVGALAGPVPRYAQFFQQTTAPPVVVAVTLRMCTLPIITSLRLGCPCYSLFLKATCVHFTLHEKIW